ncbi:TPA: hypothetical protein JY337_002504 [Escherichia coli]|nr:hypothetical protein [Escherichia coli]HAW9438996.1 hypothetical protein [Escherichia coli]
MILMSKKYTLCALVVSAILLSGCQSGGADYAADVYDTAQLNSKQETKTVNIISVLPAKVKVDNKANKEAAQTFGAVLGAVAGGVAGYNVKGTSTLGAVAGGTGGAALGAAAGSLVSDKTIVEGVSLTYKEGTKVFTSTQVGKACQFTTGLAVLISTKDNETRIQPNATCPEKK